MMYIFGFLLGLVNLGLWLAYFSAVFGWLSKRSETTSSNKSRKFWHSAQILIILPIAIIMSLGPFFSPFIALGLRQEV